MKPHFSEADLLETYYTQPGQSMPVMMHLADCDECAARYERLQRKLRVARGCDETDRPEPFWARQRSSVMKRGASSRGAAPSARSARAAAAAVLLLVVGGVLTWRQVADRTAAVPAAPVSTVATAAPAAAEVSGDVSSASDPWQSDELKDFQSMVAWESWGDPSESRPGEPSL